MRRDGHALRAFRRPSGFGFDLRFYERVDSTNAVALKAGLAGAPEGLVVLADEQTAGRGRLDRSWLAPAGSSLLLSMLFRPPAPFAATAPRIPLACALALHTALSCVAPLAPPLAYRLKWPNDAIVERPDGTWGKVAGMLSEIGSIGDEPSFVVVGIGINVNITPELLPHIAPGAASLLAEQGAPVPRPVLLEALLSAVDSWYAALCAGGDVLSAWRDRLAWMGRSVELRGPTETVVGIAESIASDGALCLRLPSGEQRCFSVGDVSLRPFLP